MPGKPGKTAMSWKALSAQFLESYSINSVFLDPEKTLIPGLPVQRIQLALSVSAWRQEH